MPTTRVASSSMQVRVRDILYSPFLHLESTMAHGSWVSNTEDEMY